MGSSDQSEGVFWLQLYSLSSQPTSLRVVKREEEGEAGERGVGGWSKEKGKGG
jgi:hypothetical protein